MGDWWGLTWQLFGLPRQCNAPIHAEEASCRVLCCEDFERQGLVGAGCQECDRRLEGLEGVAAQRAHTAPHSARMPLQYPSSTEIHNR